MPQNEDKGLGGLLEASKRVRDLDCVCAPQNLKRTLKHWDSLSRDAVQLPSLEV